MPSCPEEIYGNCGWKAEAQRLQRIVDIVAPGDAIVAVPAAELNSMRRKLEDLRTQAQEMTHSGRTIGSLCGHAILQVLDREE